jgi:uncharacterized protein (UPF0248 family)
MYVGVVQCRDYLWNSSWRFELFLFLRGSAPYFAFETIQNNGRLRVENCQICIEENGVYVVNVEIVSISEIYKVSVIVYFVTEGQITQPPAVRVCQIVSKRNTILLFGGELDNDHCYGLLPVKEKER